MLTICKIGDGGAIRWRRFDQHVAQGCPTASGRVGGLRRASPGLDGGRRCDQSAGGDAGLGVGALALAALAEEYIAVKIWEAISRAGPAALGYLERHGCASRVGCGGQIALEGERLVVGRARLAFRNDYARS